MRYKVQIKSIGPMLHHSSYNIGMDTTRKKKGGNAILGDTEEWKKTIYFDESFGVYLPSISLEASFIEAAKQFKMGRGTYSKYFKSGVFINEIMLPFYVEGSEIKTLEDKRIIIDRRTVKNPATKGRNMRYRAMFKEWESEFDVTIAADDYIDKEILQDVMNYAGKFIGVGDYRPRFGRFTVVSMKKL